MVNSGYFTVFHLYEQYKGIQDTTINMVVQTLEILKMPVTTVADDILIFFYYYHFLENIRFGISHMKCQFLLLFVFKYNLEKRNECHLQQICLALKALKGLKSAIRHCLLLN